MAAINTCSDFGVVPLFLKCVCVFIVYYNLCIGYLVCFQFLAIVYVQEFRVYGYLDEILSGYVTLFKKYLLAWSYFDYILRCLLRCFVSICLMKLSVSHWGQRPIVLIFYSPLLNTLPGKQEAFVFLNEFKGFLRSRKLIPKPYESNTFHPTSGTAAAAAKSLQSCPTLCDTIDGSPLGSSVPGILQARILEWVAVSFSNAWKWKVKVKRLSRARLLATPWTAAFQAPLSMGFSRQEYWSGLPLPSPKLLVLGRVEYADKDGLQWSWVSFDNVIRFWVGVISGLSLKLRNKVVGRESFLPFFFCSSPLMISGASI